MATDDLTGPVRDDHDEALARRFRALDAVAVPEVWDRILPPAPPAIDLVEISRRPRGGRLLAVAAAVVALSGAGWLASQSLDRTGTTAGPAGGPGVATDLGGCDGERLASALGPATWTAADLPATPTELAAGTVLVSGTLDSVRRGGDGAVVRVEVASAVGLLEGAVPDTVDLAVPAAGDGIEAEAGVSGSFVAYVDPATTGTGTWRVVPGGLWVACGSDAPAAPVLGVADTGEWAPYASGEEPLGALWSATLFPDGRTAAVRLRSLPPPVLPGDGTAVLDLDLITSDRFRVAVPESLADGFDQLSEPAWESGDITLSGAAGGGADPRPRGPAHRRRPGRRREPGDPGPGDEPGDARPGDGGTGRGRARRRHHPRRR